MLQLLASSRQLMLCHQTFSEFIPITPIKSVVSNLAEDSLWGWVKTAKKTTATKENESEKLCIRVNSKKPGSSFQHHKQLWKFCVIITGVGGAHRNDQILYNPNSCRFQLLTQALLCWLPILLALGEPTLQSTGYFGTGKSQKGTRKHVHKDVI